MGKPRRVILHVDMDAFFASIEQRDKPSLRGLPVIVGGPERRGVVSTCSYEARPFGVHSAMPMAQALRLCPQAVVVSGDMRRYAEVSRQVMNVMDRFSPVVEQVSVDEAFVDMTGCEGLFGEPLDMAKAIKEAVFEQTQLHSSVGIAQNKFLAKLASDLQKPSGITLVPWDNERAFIAPFSVRKLWGVGVHAYEKLAKVGLITIGSVAKADCSFVERALGKKYGRQLHALANAQDPRLVVSCRVRKSVGSEATLAYDIVGRAQVEKVLTKQCVRVAKHLRHAGFLAGGLRVKLRYSDGFRLATRQASLSQACDDSRSLIECAFEQLARFDLNQGIRLVGAAGFDLELCDSGVRQFELFEDGVRDRRSQREHTMDAIEERFGDKIAYGQ